MKRICITSERLNSYQTRVLTSGMDIAQYEKNPVLLYMHERGQVIGFMKDLKVEENGTITGEPVFDEATELSRQCKAQYEFGSLRMASVGIDVLELSEDPSLLVPGQTRPTVTKSKLFEVSMVDIGANDDAIRLHKDGTLIELGKDGECALPLMNNKNNQNKIHKMEMKDFALMLGMQETATESEIRERVALLQKASEKVKTMQQEKEALTLTAITTAVETAISEKRIGAEKKEQFIELGKKTGLEELKNVFGAMTPQVKLSAMLNAKSGEQAATYQKLSDVPAEQMQQLRAEQPEEYKRLYKAEYGMDCEL